jgi:serine O-acetyltransferase
MASGPAQEEPVQISSSTPDWSREACRCWEWKPSHQLLRALRDFDNLHGKHGILDGIKRKHAVLRHRFWSIVTGADIPLSTKPHRIAGGLVMPHPNGIVIHPHATIGPNCLLFQQVTIGTGSVSGLPEIGGHVDIGAGARILGGIHIGDHAIIGANAVVLSDVPENSTAVGIPARTIPPSPSK